MTFDIGLHEVCVRVGLRYVITKFSRMDSLPNFLTHGAPQCARFARAGAPLLLTKLTDYTPNLHILTTGEFLTWLESLKEIC